MTGEMFPLSKRRTKYFESANVQCGIHENLTASLAGLCACSLDDIRGLPKRMDEKSRRVQGMATKRTCSPMAKVVSCIWDAMIMGITLASTMRRLLVPWTRRLLSTTPDEAKKKGQFSVAATLALIAEQ